MVFLQAAPSWLQPSWSDALTTAAIALAYWAVTRFVKDQIDKRDAALINPNGWLMVTVRLMLQEELQKSLDRLHTERK